MHWLADHLNWKVMLMSLIANILAILLMAIILPGIQIQDLRLIFIVVVAIALGLLNTFIKPILQVITIRLLFITFGLILLLTNTIILLLLDWLFDNLTIDGILPAIFGGILISLFSMFFDYLLGVTPPIGYQQALQEQEIYNERT